jgi:hypothetical protein
VGGKYSYSDLDDLIVNHVKAMAKKVDEMMLNEKYKEVSKAETGESIPYLHTLRIDPILITPFPLPRPMARDLYQGQPSSLGICVLYQS